VLLGFGILTTLGREIIFANFLGVSRDLEVFRIAFALPNMLSQSLAPAYIGALLPALVMAKKSGAAEYASFCQRLARVSVAGVLLVTFVGVLTVVPQASLMAPGFEASARESLVVALLVCWGFFLLTGLSFLPRLFLNSRQEFWPGSSTSVVISLCLITAAVIAASKSDSSQSFVLAGATVVAGGIILLVHLIREPQPVSVFLASLRRSKVAVGEAGHAILAPLVFVLSLHVVNTLPRFVDRAFGSSLEPGTVASLDYSFNILTVPGILLGTSVITIFYPAFVQRVQDENRADLSKRIVVPVLGVIVMAFVAGVGINWLATDIITLVYARGAFGETAIQSTSTLLGWHGLGLGFMVAAMILFQACLAYRVFKWLLLITVARILSKWLAVEWLVPRYGLDGLGSSFIVPELVSTALLAVLLFMLYRRGRSN
jgi:putative peptidoglycan lipid II flippase